MRNWINETTWNQVGKLTTLAAATVLALGSFADRASAVTVREGCYTGGFGSIYAPDLQVDENGNHCSAFTPEEMRKIQEEQRGEGRDNERGGEADTGTDTGGEDVWEEF